jgi:MFS family permease
MLELEVRKHLRYNFTVNMLDGAFFGAAMGLASFVTVIPLFVSTLTDSVLLIGLIPAIHSVGWQLPQLLTVNWIARLRRYKPMVILMTINERLPFFGLMVAAWLLPSLGRQAILPFTFILLIWQGLGGGFGAAAWQSLIGKIIPAQRRGTFYGVQAAIANLMASGGAVLAGILLDRLESPLDFSLCFLLAGLSLGIGWLCYAQTREPEGPPPVTAGGPPAGWHNLVALLRRDTNFGWFVVVRIVSQVALMASAFYTVYAVRTYGISAETAGLMTGVLMAAQTVANPVMGWAGDRWSHRTVMEVGGLAMVASTALAWLSPGPAWFYLVFALAGVAFVAFWTSALTITLEFGSEADRPVYIGLSNTLIAPATMAAPLLGGWLADTAGYGATFLLATAGGLAATLILHFMVRDPRRAPAAARPAPALEA